MANNQDLESGARQVEAAEHVNAGLTEPRNLSSDGDDVENGPVATMLGELTLSMFQQGSSVRVRAGSATSASELYEAVFESADEANTALLGAGILTPEQVPDITQPVGIGLHISGITAEQLKAAGLKRHNISTL